MRYKVNFYSDWQCGTGTAAGADVDELCLKDNTGFPYIPGRTLKGLLKEAAKYFATFASDTDQWKTFISDCFGYQADDQKKYRDSDTGSCYFSNATLTKTLKQKIMAEEKKEQTKEDMKNNRDKDQKENKQKKIINFRNHFYRKIASTAIDNNGIAKEHSLRKKEVAVPVTLFGEISGLPEEYREKMEKCLAFVKRLGTNRNRGLGRCRLTAIKEESHV